MTRCTVLANYDKVLDILLTLGEERRNLFAVLPLPWTGRVRWCRSASLMRRQGGLPIRTLKPAGCLKHW